VALDKIAATVATDGSVLELVEFVELVELSVVVGPIITTTVVEPVNTPTILTREVSRILSRAQRLLIKLVFYPFMKKLAMGMLK